MQVPLFQAVAVVWVLPDGTLPRADFDRGPGYVNNIINNRGCQ
jgi:hypothetical protein